MGNVGLYSVGKEMRKAQLKSSRQRVLWITIRLAKLRSDLWDTIWQKTVQIPAHASYVAFCELSTFEPVTLLSSQLFTKFTHSTLTLNPTNIQGNDWTKYNQIWRGIKANKNIVVNHNFTHTQTQTHTHTHTHTHIWFWI